MKQGHTEQLGVVALVERAARAHPQKVAVTDSDQTLSYGDLILRADRLARHLRRLGVGPGDLVGQCVERSAALVVGALATLRAGAAYVAIDPAYPDERIAWMLADARVGAVVTDIVNAQRLQPGDRPTAVLGPGGDPGPDTPASDGDAELPPPAAASDGAYVVYTSGSTGRPKGVLVEHAALSNLIAWHNRAFALTRADRCTQIASPGFDAAVWEIWPALAAGATLHVVPEQLRRDPLGLRDWLIDRRITVGFYPTAVAEALIALPWPADAPLRHLLTGGDALSRRPPAGLPFALVNNYGLSETAVVATSGPVSNADDDRANSPPSIGRPIDGVTALVVDERLTPVAQGATGELLIGGVALARGYLHRDDLTAERFFADERGRWYRTGDLVREHPDGQLDFLGRADDQLSLRGFRVEPAEIVAALNDHPGIVASAVLGVGGDGQRLVAYVVQTGEGAPDDEQLSAFLAERLPDYMVPSAYVRLDALPLTVHGKLDRDRLAELAPPSAERPTPKTDVRQPATAVEKAIAAVLCELLEVQSVGLDENFFLLGGHSMLGAQLIVRLEDLFGAEISLRFLFDHPTLAQIAEEVNRQAAETVTS